MTSLTPRQRRTLDAAAMGGAVASLQGETRESCPYRTTDHQRPLRVAWERGWEWAARSPYEAAAALVGLRGTDIRDWIIL